MNFVLFALTPLKMHSTSDAKQVTNCVIPIHLESRSLALNRHINSKVLLKHAKTRCPDTTVILDFRNFSARFGLLNRQRVHYSQVYFCSLRPRPVHKQTTNSAVFCFYFSLTHFRFPSYLRVEQCLLRKKQFQWLPAGSPGSDLDKRPRFRLQPF